MTNRKISHTRGKGSLNHNNRNHIYENVDPSRVKDNIYYAKESLSEAYQKCFGQALEDYNSKQKRNDRKIEDYYVHLFGNASKDTVATSSNKENSFYEIVVCIGDKDTCAVGSADGELAVKILDEYAKGFSERNPNFYVFNSVLHLDEKTPHLHIDYVPIATGYKNGLEARNSQSVALQQMGFGKNKNSISEWRIQERKILKELCERHGLEIAEETQGRGKTYTPDEYKKIRDETKDQLQNMPDFLDEIREDYIKENRSELVAEAQEQASIEINEIKNTLAETIRPIEGKIAKEKLINDAMDNIKENKIFGKTTIKFDGTKEEAIAVLNAAKDRDSAKKSMDKAIAEKDTAIKERKEAIKAKNTAEKNAKKQIETANALEKEATEKMNKAEVILKENLHIHNSYYQTISERDNYRATANKATSLEKEIKKLKEELEGAYESIGAMAKANCSLLYDPTLKLNNPTPEQERLLQATRNYAAAHSKKAGFEDIALDIAY